MNKIYYKTDLILLAFKSLLIIYRADINFAYS